MTEKDFDKILDECIDRINKGEDIDDCLKSYPAYAAELEPALKTALNFKTSYSFVPSHIRKLTNRQRLQTALEALEKKRQKRTVPFFRMLRWPIIWATSAVVLLIIAVISYIGLSPTITPPAYAGLLEVRITDAREYNISRALVSVDSIQVHNVDGGDNNWLTIIDKEKTFDLVALTGVEEVIGSKSIETGEYDGIRLEIKAVNLIIDGQEQAATVPSGKLKLLASFRIEQDGKTILTLDFDLDKSVVITGNNKVHFKPVIKVSTR